MANKHHLTLEVPIYSYAKKILEYHYGKNLEKDKLKRDFLIAVGNLMKHNYYSQLPAPYTYTIPLEIITITEALPIHIYRLLSIYDKDKLRFSLGSYLNKRAFDIAFIATEILLNQQEKDNKKKSVMQTLEMYKISDDDIDHDNMYKRLAYLRT